MLLVDVGEPSLRTPMQDMSLNYQQLRVELVGVDEQREVATVRVEACRRMIARRYNSKVQLRSFKQGDLVNDVWKKLAYGWSYKKTLERDGGLNNVFKLFLQHCIWRLNEN